MLPQPPSPPSATADDRETRVRALLEQLRPHVERAARRMAESLVDCRDAQLFGELEFALRDEAHDLAAAAHQTGLANVAYTGLEVFVQSPEATEGVTAFMEKRTPDFAPYVR